LKKNRDTTEVAERQPL